MVGHVGWNMILSVSISFPEKQKGFVDLVVKLGVDSGGGLREFNLLVLLLTTNIMDYLRSQRNFSGGVLGGLLSP